MRILQQMINQQQASANSNRPINIFGQPILSNQMPPFSEGDRVVIMSGTGVDSTPEANPHWGKNGEFIAGTIQAAHSSGRRFLVVWDNGRRNEHDLAHCNIVLLEDAPQAKKKAFGKKVELDTTKLDPLIIDPEIKLEIVALLQQHKHGKKIFEE